jgi:hypothetical protein
MRSNKEKNELSEMAEPTEQEFSSKYESMLAAWKQTQRTRMANTRKGDGFSLKREVVKITAEDDPLLIILVKGSYTYNIYNENTGKIDVEEYPNILSISHYNKPLNNGLDCTAGLKKVNRGGSLIVVPGDEPCVSCELIRQGNKAISANLRNYITAALPGNWHLVQSKDAKGNDTEEWVSCNSDVCRLCDKGIPSQYGRRGLLIIGPSHYNSLIMQKETVLSKVCSNCGGTLKVVKYICPNCRKKYALAKELTKEEAKLLRRDGGYCKECNYEGYMFPIYKCNNCNDPIPLDIWGTPILLSKLGEGTTSSYSITLPGTDDELSDSEKEELSKYMIPYTSEECLNHMSLDKQSEKFKVQNPYTEKKKGYAAWNDNEDSAE